MTTAAALAILAAVIQFSDKPQLPTNIVPASVSATLQPYTPDALYAGATSTGEALIYVGGATWKTGKRWGFGAEYRQWREPVEFAGTRFSHRTHIAGPYLYRELPHVFGSLIIRTEAGVGVLWSDGELQVDETWAASVRASARLPLSDKINFVIWSGGVRVGETTVADAMFTIDTKQTDFVETGVALEMRFGE